MENLLGDYKDIRELRAKAVQYYAKTLQGTFVENTTLKQMDADGNGTVCFTGAGKREFKNSSAKEDKLLLVCRLPQLIRDTQQITAKDSSKDRHDGESFYYLHAQATLNGSLLPVEITLVKRNDGSIQYYNHTLPSQEIKKT